MSKQGAVKKYICPNWWVLIVGVGGFLLGIILTSFDSLYQIGIPIWLLSVFPLAAGLFRTLPGLIRTSGTISRLRRAGQLRLAEAELASGRRTETCNRKAACTEHFLFARKGGNACAYSDVLWTYKHRFTRSLLLIPIHTSESVMVHTRSASFRIDLGGKDKNNELVELIKTIYRHNPRVLVGFTEQNKRAYRALTRAR